MEMENGQRYKRTQENALQQWDAHMSGRRRQQGFLSGEFPWICTIESKFQQNIPFSNLFCNDSMCSFTLCLKLWLYTKMHGVVVMSPSVCKYQSRGLEIGVKVRKIPYLDV